MGNLYSGAEIVFKCLEDQKVKHIFGYHGGAVLPIYDEFKNHPTIKHIFGLYCKPNLKQYFSSTHHIHYSKIFENY